MTLDEIIEIASESSEFTQTMSSNEVWYGTDTTERLTDVISDIAQAAKTLDTSKAAANHTHTGYAATDHTHTGYAATDHTHTGYAAATHSHSYNDLSDKPTIPEAYTHPASHPASMITGLSDVATSGSYNDLTDKPTIPTVPSSLPANGGNADTVDNKHASDFALASHTHDYADTIHSHSAATTSDNGFMSAADKTKLNGIATGATKITVDSELSSTSTNPVQNKVINTALAGKAASDHTHAAQIITASLTANTYNVTVDDDYENVPLSATVVAGSALTLSGNKIKIGAGVSKVMISAQLCIASGNTNINRYLAIRNGTTQLARSQLKLSYVTLPQTMVIASQLVSVEEGDLLSLDFCGKSGDTIYGNNVLTYMTVQKIA